MPEKQELVCDGCQKTLRIPQKFWGKKVRCPQCSHVLSVPAAPPADDEVLEDVEFIDDHDPFADDSPYQNEDPYADLSAATAAPPRRRSASKPKRKKKKQDQEADSGGGAFALESRMSGSGVLGGIGLMALAFVWFFGACLFLDRIFIYPPILFIIGLVAFVKGLIGAD